MTSDDYNQKVLTAQASTNAAAEQAAYAKTCTVCGKNYFSENAYQNHLLSQKHKQRALNLPKGGLQKKETNGESISSEAEAEFEEVVAGMKKSTIQEDSIPGRPANPAPGTEIHEHPLSPIKGTTENLPVSKCLFCNYDSPNLKLNVLHMVKIHSLFIPEQKYLVDLEGLIGYLQAKIYENHECISCHKLKGTTPAVQTHMRDKGHCMIAFEKEEEMIEIGQFYDFSSTYSDEEVADSDTEMEQSVTNGGAKLENGEDDGWETDSDDSSVATDEITSIPNDDRTQAYERMKLTRHHSNTVDRPHKNADGYHSHAHNRTNAVFYDDHEMHLPSGRVAGHRSLKKYFRQNLHSYPTQAERMARAQRLLHDASPEDEEMQDVDSEAPKSQALLRRGEAGMMGVTSAQRAEVQKSEQKSRTAAQRSQNRYQAKLERQANSQKHFRDPLLQ